MKAKFKHVQTIKNREFTISRSADLQYKKLEKVCRLKKE